MGLSSRSTGFLSKQINEFSFDFFVAVRAGHKSNLAVSPIGSYLLSVILWNALESTVRTQALQASRFQLPELEPIAEFWKEWVQTPSLHLSQKIFLDQNLKLKPEFLEAIGGLLPEPVANLPLNANRSSAFDSINAWIEEGTNGLLRGVMKADASSGHLDALFLSILYFKGQWRTGFPKEQTCIDNFYCTDGRTVSVHMMSVLEDFEVLRFERGVGVCLPYKDGMEMVLLLPNQGVDEEEFLARFDPSLLESRGYSQEVEVGLPRFDFEVRGIDLKNVWGALGLGALTNSPVFASMVDEARPVENVNISHHTYIKTDEEGTEAAAVTVYEGGWLGDEDDPPPPMRIWFDRPFYFALRHRVTSCLMMLGKVEEPVLAASGSGRFQDGEDRDSSDAQPSWRQRSGWADTEQDWGW